jgi:hypothetical protein
MNQPKKPTSSSNRPAGKPGAAKPQPKQPVKSGDGLMGWLGRQFGHVKKAVTTDVTKKPAAKQSTAQGGAAPKAAAPRPASNAASRPHSAEAPTSSEKIIYREDKIEEAALPDRPGVILRRTIIDEVVVEAEATSKDMTGKRD